MQLTTAEIIRKVRELEIKSKKLTTRLLSGEFYSAFKGLGMAFKEVREYYHGDDPRFIDWNVSARFGHPFSKVFEEERERLIMILVDTSSSSALGTTQYQKDELITELTAVLTFSAVNNNDKVGVIFFSDTIEKYIQPKKGRQHASFIVRELLVKQKIRKGTNLKEALKFFTSTIQQKTIVFIISDFITDSFSDVLKMTCKRNEVTGIQVYDRLDKTLPSIGIIQAEDPETGNLAWIDTSDPLVQLNYTNRFIENEKELTDLFRKSGAGFFGIRTDEDYLKILKKYFIRFKKHV
jgi:uncharacterized protein (DUF58 family)